MYAAIIKITTSNSFVPIDTTFKFQSSIVALLRILFLHLGAVCLSETVSQLIVINTALWEFAFKKALHLP